VGICPSSSHTVGPMVAANRFLAALDSVAPDRVKRVEARLHGSLAFTGRGHGTDTALILGLSGLAPEDTDPDAVPGLLADVRTTGTLRLGGALPIDFDPERDIVFDLGPPLPQHPNGLVLRAADGEGTTLIGRTYFSVGGGFVVGEEGIAEVIDGPEMPPVPYPFASAAEMLAMGGDSGLGIADMKRANEATCRGEAELDAGLDRIWDAMARCIERGLREEGRLPGGLGVERRAARIVRRLEERKLRNDRLEHTVMDWLSVYAIAVNEENAAGSRVVTAPTNGAAGVVPAVLRYYLDFCPGARPEDARDFLLTAAAIGGIIKWNASISGAEVGCQGEVGSAAAMAAAGLCAVLGGTNAQIENAAEIAIEHHLGMTCDPIGGLVQIPCIERNAMGAVKAVNAASLALQGDGTHFVPLDSAIETMRQTGLDMLAKYKETSEGGLAVNVTEC